MGGESILRGENIPHTLLNITNNSRDRNEIFDIFWSDQVCCYFFS